MKTISIKNWEAYQHYKDRNPPWIKLYHTLLDDYQYSCLQDDSKLLLITFFLLASRTNNKIPADPEWIKNRGCLRKKVMFDELVSAGFIKINNDCKQDDSTPIAERKQSACLETYTTTEKTKGIPKFFQSDFDHFWSLYPLKKSKGQAETTWKKLLKANILPMNGNGRPDLPFFENVLEQQKDERRRKKEAGEFVPEWKHPSTWLNSRAWEDETDGGKFEVVMTT